MKVRNGFELLVPTVQYGNVKLFTEVTLDTEVDLGRIDQAVAKFGIAGDANSNQVVEEAGRRLAIEELVLMKQELNKLDASVYSLPKPAAV